MATSERSSPWWAVPLLVVSLPFVLVGLLLWCAAAMILLLVVWATWCTRGRYALLVYSNSPIWQDYFERHVVPIVGERGVVLNWSDRRRWPYSLPVALFRVFGGRREFNPLAVVFRPLAWPQRFRFYRPFQALKHGQPQEVEDLRVQLFALLDTVAPTPRGH
jgi:hypothetical protein